MKPENAKKLNKPEDKMERGLLLDVVVGERAAILELLSSEDQTLLIGGNAWK